MKYIMVPVMLCIQVLQYPVCSQVIRIGEKFPDSAFENAFINAVHPEQLQSFRKKLLILDFWATNCSSCLKSFPKLDSLQAKYANRIQIIAVNRESPDSTRRFFQKMKHLRKPAFPFVSGDSVLSRLFPHVIVPHHVWIDSNQVVRFITDGTNTTDENLKAFLQGKDLNLGEKMYEEQSYFTHPLQAVQTGKYDHMIQSYCLIMHCISGVRFSNAAVSTTGTGKPNRISQTCVTILQLYEIAYSEGGKFDYSPSNTIILEVSDSTRLIMPSNETYLEDWYNNNAYSFDLMVPASNAEELYLTMQQELNWFFKLSATREKREILTLVLKKIKSREIQKSKGGLPSHNLWVESADPYFFIRNQPLKMLSSYLSVSARYLGLPTPYLDETGYEGHIDFKIKKEILQGMQLRQLNKELARLNLELSVEKRLMNVLVIKEESENRSDQ